MEKTRRQNKVQQHYVSCFMDMISTDEFLRVYDMCFMSSFLQLCQL